MFRINTLVSIRGPDALLSVQGEQSRVEFNAWIVLYICNGGLKK